MESIAKAFASGADIAEFDISFDTNNKPVLSHDVPKGGNRHSYKKPSLAKSIIEKFKTIEN